MNLLCGLLTALGPFQTAYGNVLASEGVLFSDAAG